MLKLIDRIWFKIQSHARGYDAGYGAGYSDGYYDAELAVWLKYIETLKKYAPTDFSDKSFQLGYAQALAVLKGEVE